MAKSAPKSLLCPTCGAPSTAGRDSSEASLGETTKEGREVKGQALLWSVSFLVFILMSSSTLVLLFGSWSLDAAPEFSYFFAAFFEDISLLLCVPGFPFPAVPP